MTMITIPFWNRAERRMRALWRILSVLNIWLAVQLLPALGYLAVEFPAQQRGETSGARVPGLQDFALFGLVGAVLALWIAARWIDRRNPADYGVHLGRCAWWQDLAFGLALGAALMGAVFLLELTLGWVTVTGTLAAPPGLTFWRGFLGTLLIFVCVGIYEELIFRSHFQLNMAEGFHAPMRGVNARAAVLIAWVLASIVFGLAHAGNPNATPLSSLIICVAGLMLGLPFLLTGSVAIPIGLHITWNFFQGPVLGFPVSGNTQPVSLVRIAQGGPELWTGGLFGPEAGLLGLGALLLGMGLIVAYTRWRTGRVTTDQAQAFYTPARRTPAARRS